MNRYLKEKLRDLRNNPIVRDDVEKIYSMVSGLFLEKDKTYHVIGIYPENETFLASEVPADELVYYIWHTWKNKPGRVLFITDFGLVDFGFSKEEVKKIDKVRKKLEKRYGDLNRLVTAPKEK